MQLCLRARSGGIKCPQESIVIVLPKRVESKERDNRVAGREDACLVRSAESANREANMSDASKIDTCVLFSGGLRGKSRVDSKHIYKGKRQKK